MSANVESLFYVREKPWHGLGVEVQEAVNSKEAIELAGLNWTVEAKPIFTESGLEIPGYKANTRNSDNSILGIVTDRYRIVQNEEAFEFTDSLINDELRYETAGALKKGKQIWLLAKMPETMILNDKIEPYICFTNSHDGTGAIKVCMTPIRVVCQNTLNLALSKAKRMWTTKHMGDMKGKLEEAKMTLGLANDYMVALNEEADKLANIKVSQEELEAMFDNLYPIDHIKDSSRKIRNIQNMKDNFMACIYMPDISQFKGTAWGAMMAATDFADHCAPSRMTESYQENNWGKIITGHPFVDAIYNKVSV